MKMWKKTKNKKLLPLSTSGRAGMPARWDGCTSLTGKVLGMEVGEWGYVQYASLTGKVLGIEMSERG